MGTLTRSFVIESELTYVHMLLGNSVEIPSGALITIKLNEILMPPNLSPLSGIIVFSGDDEYYKIEEASYATITNTIPGSASTVSFTSQATITTLTGVSETD